MKFASLEQALGYRFKDVSLIDLALTHRSWANENRSTAAHVRDNEPMEFLGDSVLGLAIAEHLFRENPEITEGELTLMKHRLVSTPTLARIAANLDLMDLVRMGRGEEKTGGRDKATLLADTLEAVIAAIFLDGGYTEARAFIARTFAAEIRSVEPGKSLDPKTTLQELLQAQKLSAPTYTLVRSEGPPHDRTFFVEANWQGGRSDGVGRSLKLAEMAAAESALSQLRDGRVREPSN